MNNMTSKHSSPSQLAQRGFWTGALALAALMGAMTLTAQATGFPGDTNRPTVTISYPKAGLHVPDTNASLITIRGTAKDKEGLYQILYGLNGAPVENIADMVTTNGGLTATWSVTVPMTPGTNFIAVRSVDGAFNESKTITNKFYFDVPWPITLATNEEGAIKFILNRAQVTNQQPLLINYGYAAEAIVGTNGWGTIFTNWTLSSDGAYQEVFTNKLRFFMRTNLVLTAKFATNLFTPAAGKYHGLVSAYEGTGSHQSSGFFSATTDKKQKISGRLLLDGDTVPFAGKFNLDGQVEIMVSRAKWGKNPIMMFLMLDLHEGFQQIFGQVFSYGMMPLNASARGITQQDEWFSMVMADKATFNKTNNQATFFQGTYTTLVPPAPAQGGQTYTAPKGAQRSWIDVGSEADPGPSGYGYGLVTVVSNGTVKITGALADGHAISQSVPLSKNGTWPLFVPLYKGATVVTTNGGLTYRTNKDYKGSILGWVNLATNEAPFGTNLSLIGRVNWIKNAWTNSYYPNGFTNSTDLLSSKFTSSGASTNRAMALTNVIVTVSGGNLANTYTNLGTYTFKNEVKTNTLSGFKMTVAYKTGYLSGQATNLESSRPTKFYGAVLQDYNLGAGWFKGTVDQCGLFSIGENQPATP